MELNLIEEQSRAFELVRSIVGAKIPPERISKSTAKSYLAIVLDNNPHRTICRIYLNGPRKLLGTISERKVETRQVIESVEDISKFSGDILLRAQSYK